jgi:hypothetical protein
MPDTRLGTHSKRYSARIQDGQKKRKKNSGSESSANIKKKSRSFSVTIPLPGTASPSHIVGSRVSNVETVQNLRVGAVAVTPESPRSPPVIKISNRIDLFDTMSVLSDNMLVNEEEIDEVEEIFVPLCNECRDELTKTMQEFLLFGSVCHYCAVIVKDHVKMNTRKRFQYGYDGEATHCRRINLTGTNFTGANRYGGQLELTSVSRKKSKNDMELLCDEVLSEK